MSRFGGANQLFEFKDGQYTLADNGKNGRKWFLEEDGNIINAKDNILTHTLEGKLVNYGIKTVFFQFTRFGENYRILGTETHLTTMKLKYGKNCFYVPQRFRNLPFQERPASQKNKGINAISFLKEFPISEALKAETERLRVEILPYLFSAAQSQLEIFSSASELTINDAFLKILNAYIDIDGDTKLGPGFLKLSHIFNTLVGHRASTLCFNAFKSAPNREIVQTIENLKFNRDQSQIEFFKAILEMFQSYSKPTETINPTLKDLDALIEEESSKFKKDILLDEIQSSDRALIDRLFKSFIRIFGRYTYSKMITGSLYVEGGNLYFISLPWNNLKISFRQNKLSIIHHESNGNPPKAASYVRAPSFALDLIVFGPQMRIEVIDGVDIILNCPYIPIDYLFPAFKQQSKIKSSRIITYSTIISNLLLKDWIGNWRIPVTFNPARKIGNNLLFNTLVSQLEYSSLSERQFKEAKLILYRSIFTLFDNTFRTTIFNSIKNQEKVSILISSHLPRIIFDPKSLNSDIINNIKDSLDPLNIRNIEDYKTSKILKALEDPIIGFGNILKNVALKHIEDSVPKTLRIYPYNTYYHGLAQNPQGTRYYPNTEEDNDISKIDINGNLYWDFDIRDRENANKIFLKLIRGMVEDFQTIIVIVDGNPLNQMEFSLSLLDGSLRPSDILPSTDHRYNKPVISTDSLYAEELYDDRIYNENYPNLPNNIEIIIAQFHENYNVLACQSTRTLPDLWRIISYLNNFF